MITERRAAQRIPVDAQVRIRPLDGDGESVTCRVRDSSAAGVSLRCHQAMGAGWSRIEVLLASGRPADEPLEARVVWRDWDEDGYQIAGCVFDA